MRDKTTEEILMNNVTKILTSLGRNVSSITIKEIAKNNTTRLGMIICCENENVSPIIYIDKDLEQIIEFNVPISIIAGNICEIYISSVNMPNINPAKYFNKSYMKDHTILSVVNLKNDIYLENKIYKTICDLAIIPRIITEDLCMNGTNASLAVPKHVLGHYNLSEDELFEYANDTYEILDMGDLLKNIVPDEMLVGLNNSITMYVITNESRIEGASILAFPSKLAELLESVHLTDVIILPSSIHEIIILPYSNGMDLDQLKDTVKEINLTDIDPEERLSDSIYSFNTKEKVLKIIDD